MELEQRQSSTDHPIILNGPRRMDTDVRQWVSDLLPDLDRWISAERERETTQDVSFE